MSRPRVVLDNSAIRPAYSAEEKTDAFDAGLVTNRSRSLLKAIRDRRVQAFVPPSFFREFLNVASLPLFRPGGRSDSNIEEIRGQWQDLLNLPLLTIPVDRLCGISGELVVDHGCPAPDSWFVATAIQADATFWMSHDHSDGLATFAAKHTEVKLLSNEAPFY